MMKLDDIKVGEVYAIIHRMQWKDRTHADEYVLVIDNDRWWKPTWSSWSSKVGDKKRLAGYEGKSFIIPSTAKRVVKYPSDGTKGVLCVKVNDDNKPVGEYAMVVPTNSLRMTRVDFEAHAAKLIADNKARQDEHMRAQAERDDQWEEWNSRLVAAGLPNIKVQGVGWNGMPRTSWKNFRYDGGWVFTNEELEAIIDRVEGLKDSELCYALGEDY